MKTDRTSEKSSRKKAATIRDVAEASGVTAGTVSRVLNKRLGEMKVPAPTRRKIEEAADRLGYAPNIHARRLFGKRAGVLGFVVPSFQKLGTHVFENAHLTRILSGMEHELAALNYSLLLVFNDARFVSEKKYQSLYRERSVDALFVWGAEEHEGFWGELIAERRPLLFLGNLPALSSKADFVLSDDESAGFRAASHLLEKGLRQLAWIGGKEGISATRLQLAGIRRAMKTFDLDPGALAVAYGDFQEASGAEAIEALLERKMPFDALLAANGNTSQGAARILMERKLETKIVSCDSVAGMPKRAPGARVQSRDAEIGRRAVQRLAGLVEGKIKEVREWVDVDFIAKERE